MWCLKVFLNNRKPMEASLQLKLQAKQQIAKPTSVLFLILKFCSAHGRIIVAWPCFCQNCRISCKRILSDLECQRGDGPSHLVKNAGECHWGHHWDRGFGSRSRGCRPWCRRKHRKPRSSKWSWTYKVSFHDAFMMFSMVYSCSLSRVLGR